MGRVAFFFLCCFVLPGFALLGFSPSGFTFEAKSPLEAKEDSDKESLPGNWAWQPLSVGNLPRLPQGFQSRWSSWGANPIDLYLARELERNGLEPSPQADPETLLRRLYLDLTGMPPTPDDRARFLSQPFEKAWLEEIDRLLASRAYAEKWARHWLDVARFAESHGFEYDRPRENAWPYRDWVIDAFHRDLPFPDFVKNQIAGDWLPQAGSSGIAATGFLVSGPYDQAGNGAAARVIRERAREDELEEMVGTTAQAFLGLTVHCARCHDHKFDPISLKEYHGFKAALSGVKLGTRGMLGPAELGRRKWEQDNLRKQITQIDKEMASLRAQVLSRKKENNSQESYPAHLAPRRWSFWGRETPVGEMAGNARIVEGDNPGLVLDGQGSFYKTAPLQGDLGEKTLEVWVKLANLTQKGGGVLSLETLDGTRFDSIVFGELETGHWLAGSEGHLRSRPLSGLGAKPESQINRLVHLAIVYGKDGTIRVYRDGQVLAQSYQPVKAPFAFASSQYRVLVGMRHSGGGNPFFQGTVLEARVYPFALDANQIAQSHATGFRFAHHVNVESLMTPVELSQWKELDKKRANLLQSEKKLAGNDPQVFAAISNPPGVQKVLVRGDIDRPEGDAIPGGLGVLKHAPPQWGLAPDASDKDRRLALAEWIAHPKNVLAHRVWVNRIWQHHFGNGLVDTPSDFGKQGGRPSHPELLDFLSSKFAESGFQTKPIHRLILTSQAYRQSSSDRKENLAKDSQTRLIWRFPPRRLEAEAIRDSMLAVSGELKPSNGGPSFFAFKIEAFNSVFYKPLENEDPDFLKRTIYRMVIRSARSPLLESFDCPDPTVRTARRVPTTTPTQALTLMNDAFVIRRSAKLASEAQKAGGGDPAKAVEWIWIKAYGRGVRPDEKERAVTVAQKVGMEPIAWALFNSSEFLDLR